MLLFEDREDGNDVGGEVGGAYVRPFLCEAQGIRGRRTKGCVHVAQPVYLEDENT